MGLFSSGSSKRAASVQAAKLGESQAYMKNIRDNLYQDYQPYMDAGEGALARYTQLAGGLDAPTNEIYGLAQTMDPIVEQIRSGDFTKSPGYDFRLNEALKALQNSAAAKGNLYSGATGKALTRYAQDYATGEYDNFINRLRNQLTDVNTQIGGRQSALQAAYENINSQLPLIQAGQNAVSGKSAVGTNLGAQEAGNIAKQGDVFASGMIAKSNQLQNMGNALISAAGYGIGGPLGGMLSTYGQANMQANNPQMQNNQNQQGSQGFNYSYQPQQLNSSLGRYNGFVGPNNINPSNIDNTLPPLFNQGSGLQEQAMLKSASSYAPFFA